MAMSIAKVIGRVCLITAVLLSRVWAREEKDHRMLSEMEQKRKTLPPSWALWCELKRLIFLQMLSSTSHHPRQLLNIIVESLVWWILNSDISWLLNYIRCRLLLVIMALNSINGSDNRCNVHQQSHHCQQQLSGRFWPLSSAAIANIAVS